MNLNHLTNTFARDLPQKINVGAMPFEAVSLSQNVYNMTETILAIERTRRGWSQTRLGNLAGDMAQSHISAYENQLMTCGKLRGAKIAAILGMTDEELFREDRYARTLTEVR